jgi:hypothetical protein
MSFLLVDKNVSFAVILEIFLADANYFRNLDSIFYIDIIFIRH